MGDQRWAVWSDQDDQGELRPLPSPLRIVVDELPPDAERSADGGWASLYDDAGRQVKVWMRLSV